MGFFVQKRLTGMLTVNMDQLRGDFFHNGKGYRSAVDARGRTALVRDVALKE